MYFAVISQKELNYLDCTYFSPLNHPCYCFSSKGHIYKRQKNNYNPLCPRDIAHVPLLPTLKWSSGDIVSITLNPKKQTIICTVNKGSDYLIHDKLEIDERITWSIAFSLEDINDSITLLNFCEHP